MSNRLWIGVLAAGAFALLVGSVGMAQDPPGGQDGLVRQVDFGLGQWQGLELASGPVKFHRWRLDTSGPQQPAPEPAACLSGSSETLVLHLEYSNHSNEPWVASVDLSWRDEQGEVIDGGGSHRILEASAEAAQVELAFPTFGYGLRRATTAEIKIRLDDEVLRPLGLGTVAVLAPRLRGGFEPVGPAPFGRDWWRHFECGFGLPALCDLCDRLDLGCYEVEIGFAGSGVVTQAYCSTASDAGNNAVTTCRRHSPSRGFFCDGGPRYHLAKRRHLCDYPYLRFPFTATRD